MFSMIYQHFQKYIRKIYSSKNHPHIEKRLKNTLAMPKHDLWKSFKKRKFHISIMFCILMICQMFMFVCFFHSFHLFFMLWATQFNLVYLFMFSPRKVLIQPYVLYVNTSICQYVNTSICQYVNTSIRQYVSTSVRQYVNTSIRQYVSTSVCQSW